MWKSILLAGTGGFAGSVLRYLVTKYIHARFISLFPWGTLFVNIAGSLLIGMIFGLTEKTNLVSPQMRILLAVGFCGGFTTFSSFSNDAFLLLQNKEWLRFVLYAGGSFIMGLMAIIGGRALIKIW